MAVWLCLREWQLGGRAGLWSSGSVYQPFTEQVLLFTGPTGLTGLAGVTGLGSLATLFGHWLGDSSAAGLPSTPFHPNCFFLQKKREAATASFFLRS